MDADLDRIGQLAEPCIPALQALRWFTATTRGFRLREQQKLARFLMETAPLSGFSEDAVVKWLQSRAGWIDTHAYRAGDGGAYEEALKRIPAALLQRTRDYAYAIARGSGRAPISNDVAVRIEREFNEHPVVVPPTPEPDEQLGVRISSAGITPLE